MLLSSSIILRKQLRPTAVGPKLNEPWSGFSCHLLNCNKRNTEIFSPHRIRIHLFDIDKNLICTPHASTSVRLRTPFIDEIGMRLWVFVAVFLGIMDFVRQQRRMRRTTSVCAKIKSKRIAIEVTQFEPI